MIASSPEKLIHYAMLASMGGGRRVGALYSRVHLIAPLPSLIQCSQVPRLF